MDHGVMLLVLAFLAESGPAESRKVAEAHTFLSPKYVSLVLTRCYRRGFVSRRPFKRGRVRGYVNELTDEGAEWIMYKASGKEKRALYESQKTIVHERVRQPIYIVSKKEAQSPNHNDLVAFCACANALGQAQNRLIERATPDFLFWKRYSEMIDARDFCIGELFIRREGEGSTTPAMKLLMEDWVENQRLLRTLCARYFKKIPSYGKNRK